MSDYRLRAIASGGAELGSAAVKMNASADGLAMVLADPVTVTFHSSGWFDRWELVGPDGAVIFFWRQPWGECSIGDSATQNAVTIDVAPKLRFLDTPLDAD